MIGLGKFSVKTRFRKTRKKFKKIKAFEWSNYIFLEKVLRKFQGAISNRLAFFYLTTNRDTTRWSKISEWFLVNRKIYYKRRVKSRGVASLSSRLIKMINEQQFHKNSEILLVIIHYFNRRSYEQFLHLRYIYIALNFIVVSDQFYIFYCPKLNILLTIKVLPNILLCSL